MKKQIITTTAFALLATSIIFSCKKKDTPTPTTTSTTTPTTGGTTASTNTVSPSACTYTVNGNVVYTADSINWDLYSGYNRLKCFKNNLQVFTCYVPTSKPSSYNLSPSLLYWYDGLTTSTNLYNVSSGSATFSYNNDYISGSISASGNKQSGTGPSTSTINITFTDAPKR